MTSGFLTPGEAIAWPGMQVEHLATTGTAHLRVVRAVMPPGGGHPFHHHPHQEELLHVISGTVEQWIERESRILGPGDSCLVPPGVVHGSYNTSGAESVMLAVRGPCLEDGVVDTIDVSGDEPWASLRA